MKNSAQLETTYRFIMSPLYKYFTTLIVCLQVAIIIIFTIKSVEETEKQIYSYCNFICTIIFLIEYLLRLYIAPKVYPKEKPAKARLHYIFSFMGFVDLFCMLPFLVYYTIHWNVSLDLFDFARVILIFKVARYSEGFQLVISAFSHVRQQLITVGVIASIFLIFGALMLYYLEKDAQPEKFSSVGEGFWLAIITFTTVGYGDVYPITPFGKLLGACSAVIGIFMIALPSGIISSAFMTQLQSIKTSTKKKNQEETAKKEDKKNSQQE